MSARADYLLVSSNIPSPGFMNKVRVATAAGRRVLIVYLKRDATLLAHDFTAGLDVRTFRMPYLGVTLGRFARMTVFVGWLQRVIREEVAPGADCLCNSLDVLVVALLAGRGNRLRFRYDVIDLHETQLGAGVFNWLVRTVERAAMPYVHTLILTSEEYWDRYYHRLKVRRHIVVENVPRRDAWSGFVRLPRSRTYRIGFIGIVRYAGVLEALVDAVRILRAEGRDVVVHIAGGGNCLEALKAHCRNDAFVEFSGTFSYSAAIKRLYADLDLIYSVYDTRHLNVRYAMPNKFYEALIARIPIVVAAGTYLERRVLESRIGIGVPCFDARAIADALRPAVKKEGWYAAAEKALGADLAEPYFRDYETTIEAAVLSDDAALPLASRLAVEHRGPTV